MVYYVIFFRVGWGGAAQEIVHPLQACSFFFFWGGGALKIILGLLNCKILIAPLPHPHPINYKRSLSSKSKVSSGISSQEFLQDNQNFTPSSFDLAQWLRPSRGCPLNNETPLVKNLSFAFLKVSAGSLRIVSIKLHIKLFPTVQGITDSFGCFRNLREYLMYFNKI